jgi:hypothetical protein
VRTGSPPTPPWTIELLRRLNYYTQGKENQTANVFDDRQLELPL